MTRPDQAFVMPILAAIAGLLGLLVSSLGHSGVLHPGHTAHWYVPERSGEGWVLEILSKERALVYWFTYDESGGQRWLIGDGEISKGQDGWSIEFPEMLVTSGPRFGPDFDPASVEFEAVGHGRFQFTDCNSGLFEFEGFGQELTFPVQRLTRTMGSDCNTPIHGRPGEPLQSYAGQSGSWYDPATAGQGYVLQWMTNDQAVVTWFTYDAEGDQQWMLGLGHREDDRLVFPEMVSTRGGHFGDGFDRDAIEHQLWGELELELDCDGGPARYESVLPEFADGELALVRLTTLMRPAGCPALSSELTELYDVKYLELPVMNQGERPRTRVEKIAADGTVVGHRGETFGTATIFRVLQPGKSNWLDIEENGIFPVVFLSSDGNLASFNVFDGWTDEGFGRILTKIWRKGLGTQRLPGKNLGSSILRAGSPKGTCLVGTGSVEPGGPQHPWKWSAENGQQILPVQDAVGGGTPTGCSDDGRIVIGNRPLGESNTRQDIAMRWVDDKKPTFLYDSQGSRLRFAQACSADCSVIVGGDQVDLDPDHPNYREPWLWTEEHGVRYLGAPDDAILLGLAPLTAWDITSDGSFVIGSYAAENPRDGGISSRGFFWTERTGQVIVPELLADAGLSDSNWDEIRAISVAEGEDGIRILLSGFYRNPPDSWIFSRRAAVLHLVPSRTDWFE